MSTTLMEETQINRQANVTAANNSSIARPRLEPQEMGKTDRPSKPKPHSTREVTPQRQIKPGSRQSNNRPDRQAFGGSRRTGRVRGGSFGRSRASQQRSLTSAGLDGGALSTPEAQSFLDGFTTGVFDEVIRDGSLDNLRNEYWDVFEAPHERAGYDLGRDFVEAIRGISFPEIELGWPDITWPEIHWPSIEFPEITIPSWSWPQLPELPKWPQIEIPWPEFSLPSWDWPNWPQPEIEIDIPEPDPPRPPSQPLKPDTIRQPGELPDIEFDCENTSERCPGWHLIKFKRKYTNRRRTYWDYKTGSVLEYYKILPTEVKDVYTSEKRTADLDDDDIVPENFSYFWAFNPGKKIKYYRREDASYDGSIRYHERLYICCDKYAIYRPEYPNSPYRPRTTSFYQLLYTDDGYNYAADTKFKVSRPGGQGSSSYRTKRLTTSTFSIEGFQIVTSPSDDCFNPPILERDTEEEKKMGDCGCSCAAIREMMIDISRSMVQQVEAPVATCEKNSETDKWEVSTENLNFTFPGLNSGDGFAALLTNQAALAFDICQMKNGQTSDLELFDLESPVVSCTQNSESVWSATTENTTIQVPVSLAEGLSEVYRRQATLLAGECVARNGEILVDLEIPVVSCTQSSETGVWEVAEADPENPTILEVPAPLASGLMEVYKNQAILVAHECASRNKELTIAVPDTWQVKVGSSRPQLILLFGEVDELGKVGRGRWQISIPHYRYGSEKPLPSIPRYRRGNTWARLILLDNSRLLVHGKNSAEALKMIASLKKLIDPELLPVDTTPGLGQRGGTPILEKEVVAVQAQYFGQGQLSAKPDWTQSLR